MGGSPTPTPSPPPPSNSDSSPPVFKLNAPGPSSGHEAAQGASASPAAAAPPAVRAPSEALLAVLGVVGELRARGFLARLEIPEAQLTGARASALFDAVLASFIAEAWHPEAASFLPIPPPPLGGGFKVELLRLFLAVRARGGFAAVASWAAVAEDVGHGPADDMAVKLLYRKYLELLDRTFDKPLEDHKVGEGSGNAGRRLGSAKDRFLSPTKEPTSAGSPHLKRKREPLVGFLNWVRLTAKSPADPGIDRRGHSSTAVWLREQTLADYVKKLRGMFSWVHLVAKSPAAPGFIALPCGQADIPKWTGKPSSRYDDRRTLRFLGEPILLPESNEALDGGSIGKGRQDNCNCQYPGSIDCIRFHVAQKKDELKRELGPAFYKMGLDKTGEDAALTWTKGDERRFNTVIHDNLPTSKYNFWGKLRASFRSKGSKGLAGYYHNVFQVRRRAYQNHLALNADSDDDSIEPGFLYSRQGDVKGSSRTRSASSSRNGRSS
ncbi:hypothetical protein PAHAL_9G233800 [Panicum hallii]|uniref:ARID domain-containing protein n=1 Tax=Panicum hallii TaxID=206008 RepID=A0A2T8I290_9POAL|nr:hypothetical protein PAHAL_9G233800 [Panicum hallii]